MSDGDIKTTVGFFNRLLSSWPDWALVVLFLVIAVCLALTGTLDDWIRGVLAISFGGVAIVLGARANMAVGGRTGIPPEPEHDPPPSVNVDPPPTSS